MMTFSLMDKIGYSIVLFLKTKPFLLYFPNFIFLLGKNCFIVHYSFTYAKIFILKENIPQQTDKIKKKEKLR